MKTLLQILVLMAIISSGSNQLIAQWVQTNGPYGGPTTCFAVSDTNLFAGTQGGGVFLSTNNGTSWTAANTNLHVHVGSLAILGTNIFAGTWGGGAFLSTNNGTSWTAVNNGLTNDRVPALAVSDTNLFAAAPITSVFRSTNSGTSWTPTGLTGNVIYALAVSGTNIFAGTLGGFAGTHCGVYLSTDNGIGWTETAFKDTSVLAFAVSGTNLFAGTQGRGVFISTNNGASWDTASTGLTDTTVQALAVSSANLFAGTESGVFLSTNNGTTWTAVNTGFDPFTDVSALAVSDTTLFAGAGGNGVWRRPLSQIITSVESFSSEPPLHFSLEQNYPNPFNPTTTIVYGLREKTNVELKVFDVLGREVETIVNSEQDAGYYEIEFNASKLASGIYFYRLQAGSFVETKKMVLMK